MKKFLLTVWIAALVWSCEAVSRQAEAPAPSPLPARIEPTATPAPSPTPVAKRKTESHPRPPAPVLTLSSGENASTAENDTAQQSAQKALDRAAQSIAKFDRSQLNEQRAGDYDVVQGLIASARQAMDQKDFLRAQKLANKASVLASQLAIQ